MEGNSSDPAREAVARELTNAAAALDALRGDREAVGRLAEAGAALASVLRGGGKILACGNGGSCADAMHFCEELTGRYRADRPALPAVACADPTHLTCVGNDYGFDAVFARWVEALGTPGDALVVLSTSGNSANIVAAVEAASRIGLRTVALLGKGGGAVAGACEFEWIAAGGTADRIQEIHMLMLHVLIGRIEAELGHAG